jgi:Phosphotransferase enzyme family
MEQVDDALSPATIVTIIEKWPHLKAREISIEGCEVRNVRRTQEGDLELEYRFKLIKVDTADRFKATVLARVYQDDRGKEEYTRLAESWKGKEHRFADSSLKGFALYLPELRLLLHSSLTDEKLKRLQIALDPEAMKPFLGAYVCPEAGRGAVPPGKKSIRRCEVYILRYKPGKRCTLRYRVEFVDPDTCQTQQRSLIGKLYGDREEGERIFRVMRALDQRGFGGDCVDGIRIPQSFGYIHELQMLLMEDIAAPPLTDSLSSLQLGDHLQVAARALLKIHRCPLTLDREYQVEDQISSLKRAVSLAIQDSPDLAALFDSSLRSIIGQARDLPSHEPVLVHRDFHYNQVLLGSNEVTIVDFDTMCNADLALDLGDFLAHLRWKGFQIAWSEEKARSHGETFLRAYRRDLPPELMRRIDFYYRTYLLRIACRVTLRPKWRHLTVSLLNEAVTGYPC